MPNVGANTAAMTWLEYGNNVECLTVINYSY